MICATQQPVNTRYRPILHSIQLEHTCSSFIVKYRPSICSLWATCIKNPHTSAFCKFLCSFVSSGCDTILIANCSIRRSSCLRMLSASVSDLLETKFLAAHNSLSFNSGEQSTNRTFGSKWKDKRWWYCLYTLRSVRWSPPGIVSLAFAAAASASSFWSCGRTQMSCAWKNAHSLWLKRRMSGTR